MAPLVHHSILFCVGCPACIGLGCNRPNKKLMFLALNFWDKFNKFSAVDEKNCLCSMLSDMKIKGSERQEKIIKAWTDTLSEKVEGLSIAQAENYVRKSISEAENITVQQLEDMDKLELSDPAKAKFVGHVVSIMYHMVAHDHTGVDTENLRRMLIDVYQQFPDHTDK